MKKALSPFQVQCEEKLSAALRARGHDLIDSALVGQTETFIKAKVAGTELEVYIYSDEAQFHKSSVLVGLFERPDYESSSELQNAFIQAVTAAAIHG